MKNFSLQNLLNKRIKSKQQYFNLFDNHWKYYNFESNLGAFDNFLVFIKKEVKIFDVYGYVHLENIKRDVRNFGIFVCYWNIRFELEDLNKEKLGNIKVINKNLYIN